MRAGAGSALGWYLNDTSQLDIQGFGLGETLIDPFLDLDGSLYSEYLLSGTLLDGTTIDGKLLFVSANGTPSFDLINEPGGGTAPEPQSSLLAIGWASLRLAKRRDRARRGGATERQ